MDNQRLLIWATFALLAWMTYSAWMEDYGPQPEPAQQASEQADTPTPIGSEPGLIEPGLPELDVVTDEVPAAPGQQEPAAAPDDSPVDEAPVIHVKTDVLEVDISTIGGTLQKATLLGYPVAKDRPDDLVELLDTDRQNLGLLRTGLRFGEGGSPDHNATFTSTTASYELGSAEELVVPLRWTNDEGVEVEKRFVFRPGSYAIGVQQEVRNRGQAPVRTDAYLQILRRNFEIERSMFDVDSYSFDGPVIFDSEKKSKIDRDDLIKKGPYDYDTANGWLGTIQHHFVNAIVPPRDELHKFHVGMNKNNDVAVLSVISGKRDVAPGSTAIFETTAFVGPKLQSQLEDIDPKLKLTVDYGWLTILSQPLFWLLAFVYDFVGNWGVAIVIVTILIKLAFYKLTESSGRSMAKMRNLQPRMKALQERYKDDRQALSQAMMDLYKREKVNPAAGCLPILIQMPFFLAFYWVLLESVEMRQAPFALWITDLSSRDPFFILPLIMGAAMFFQQKLNPAPADPVQARVMQIMPVIFTAFFAFFPAGLVLYWVTNTLLSIAQQWKINKVVEQEAKAEKSGKKKKSKDG